MKSEPDIERIIDAWLAPGPTEMPDRLFAAVLERVDRTPQRRGAWPPMRIPPMFGLFKLPAAAAVAALIIGLVAAPLWLSDPRVVDAPGQASALPDALVSNWVAAPRAVEGLDVADTLAGWRVNQTGTQLVFELDRQGYGKSHLRSEISPTGPSQIRLTTLTDNGGCPKGSVGTYDWALSEHDTRIRLVPVGDECAQRAAYLSGVWADSGCSLELLPCSGLLEPGRHGSALFDPRGAPHDPPVARPGGLSYAVPQGWANAVDWLSHLRLIPADVYERMYEQYDLDLRKDQVSLWARPVAIRADEPDCLIREDASVGGSVEGLAAWLTVHPSLTTTVPEPILIDGHQGLVIDVDMASAATQACDELFEGSPGVLLFANGHGFDSDGVHRESSEQDHWSIGVGGICPDCGTDPQRIILLDLDGDPLVIVIDSEDPEDQAALVQRAMPVVETFAFPH